MLHPESDGPGRAAFIKTITGIPDPTLRAQTIGKLVADLDPAKQAALDVVGIADSADRVASPEYQAEQDKAIAIKDAWVKKQFEPDPTLKGTLGQFWSGQTGQLLTNAALAFTAPAIRTSAFAAQIYGTARDRVKADHPDWTDEQAGTVAAESTFAQLAPQELLMAASHGILAPLIGWARNPVVRFGIGGGVHLATGAAGGALMQTGANVAEGQPIGEGVGEAALGGAIQAAPFAIHGGVHAALTPHEAVPVAKAPLAEEPVTPPAETGPKGGEVHGATAETMATGGEEADAPPPAAHTEAISPPLPLEAHSDQKLEQRSMLPIQSSEEGERGMTDEEAGTFMDRLNAEIERRHQARTGKVGLMPGVDHSEATVHENGTPPPLPPQPASGTPERFALRAQDAAAPGLRLSVPEANKVVNTFKEQFPHAPPIDVVGAREELSPHLQQAIAERAGPNAVESLIHDGRIHVVAGENTSPEALHRTLLEEAIGHYGVEQVLGNKFNQLADVVSN